MIFLKLCQLLLKWPIFVVSPKGNLDFLDPKKFNNIDHINNFSFETINRRLLNFGFLKNLLQLNNIDEILFRRFMILVFCALTKMFVRSPPPFEVCFRLLEAASLLLLLLLHQTEMHLSLRIPQNRVKIPSKF